MGLTVSDRMISIEQACPGSRYLPRVSRDFTERTAPTWVLPDSCTMIQAYLERMSVQRALLGRRYVSSNGQSNRFDR